jgi:metal-dependent hydrolase (beta-lactamase superfamily II)
MKITVDNLKVGDAFTMPLVNPLGNVHSGIVESIRYAGNYTIIHTVNGGFHRIHNGHIVECQKGSVIL